MLIFPQAKINLGLNVVRRRPDGYHDLETVFFPVALHDALELTEMDPRFPSSVDCDLKVTGMAVDGDEQSNLVVRAYRLLRSDHPQMPRVHAHLHKAIPMQAGMGGGSSDGAAMLVALNTMFSLGLTTAQLASYAARLGADCAFFVTGAPAYAEGIGDRLTPVSLDLSAYSLAIVRPDIPVSTREAYAHVSPHQPLSCCRDIVAQPVETWRHTLVNDFEQSVFALHPEIAQIKEWLYRQGAVYAAMSGSGSAVFGLFRQPPTLSGIRQTPWWTEGTYTAVLSAS